MKLNILLIIALLASAAFAQSPCVKDGSKHQLGVSYNFLRRDTTYQSIRNPNLHFTANSDSSGVRIHGTDFIGECNGSIFGFVTEASINRGSGRKMDYVGMGVVIQPHSGLFEPFAKATFGVSHQNDVPRDPTSFVSFRGNGGAANLAVGLDLKVSKHVSVRVAEISYFRTDMFKSKSLNLKRDNLTAGAGLAFHW